MILATTGKGIRGVQWKNFAYSNTIIEAGEDVYKTGWTLDVRFHLDSTLSVFPILKALRRYGIRVVSGGHLQKHHSPNDIDHGFTLYILSDDYAIQGVQRRFADHDREPGEQPLQTGGSHRGWWRAKA